MKVVRLALLLIVQLSYVYAHADGGVVYKCDSKNVADVTVKDASAQLTDGCVFHYSNYNGNIDFDIKAMYDAASKNPSLYGVVINISQADFINTYIKLTNAHSITDISTLGPLLFTMSNSNMSGTSKLEFGDVGKIFKLPPHSRLRILQCVMTISADNGLEGMLTFYSLQLVTDSSMEIAHNVITMAYKGDGAVKVFYLPTNSEMKVSDNSSFTIQDNMIALNRDTTNILNQYVWFQWDNALLTISDNSNYTWSSNNITMVAYDVTDLTFQYVWYQRYTSQLTIHDNSIYSWISNVITMLVYGINQVIQSLWESNSQISVSGNSQLLMYTNSILLLARDYTRVYSEWSQLMRVDSAGTAISNNSSVVWKGNCVAMGHKKTDKRYVFIGKWTITDNSELLLEGNNITTTEEYTKGVSGLTEFVWGPTEDTDITINTGGTLTIRNTKVHANSPTSGATNSMLWYVSLYTSKANVKQPNIEWGSSPAKDGSGVPILTIDNSNIQQYMCEGIPSIPPTITPTVTATPIPDKSNTDETKPTTTVKTTTKPDTGITDPKSPTTKVNATTVARHNKTITDTTVTSATAVLSTIPGVLITSVVFLYLYNM